jgi:hypothetical protein
LTHTFTKRGFGRIYVADAQDIDRVSAIIKQMDAFEHGYLPQGFIAPFSEYPKTLYAHKFSDLDLNDLTAACFKQNIFIFCFDSGFTEYPPAYTLPPIEPPPPVGS